MICPECGSGIVIKYGKKSSRQIYRCRECRRKFISDPKGRYSRQIMVDAICFHSLGDTLEDVTLKLRRTYRKKISKSTVHRWISDAKGLTPILGYRRDIGRLNDPILVKDLLHSGLLFRFSIHRFKLERSGMEGLSEYLLGFQDRPEFQDGNRCSSLKAGVDVPVVKRKDLACDMVSFCLDPSMENRKRHELVERFLLTNDDVTVATEVPVYFWDKKIGSVTGHIDVLQVKNGKVRILDYKPNASREHPEGQILNYARALSYRTKVSLKDMECAWFDGKDCYSFDPSKAVWKWR